MKIPFTNFRIELINDKRKTIMHPDVQQLMEYAFTLKDKEGKGHDYYNFVDARNMPILRFQALAQFKDEVNDRMTNQELRDMVSYMKACIDSGQGVKLSGIIDGVKWLEYCSEMFIDMNTFERLMTCYFIDMTLNEDVTDYDYEFNKKKQEIFASQPVDSFFFKKPVLELLPLEDPSTEDLEVFLAQTKVKEELTRRALQGMRENLNISEEQGPAQTPKKP